MLDQPDAPVDEGLGSRMIYYGILGLLAGAVTGGLFSIVLASIISTDCFSDNCIFKYLTACSAIGAVGGIAVGLKLARSAVPSDQPPPSPTL